MRKRLGLVIGTSAVLLAVSVSASASGAVPPSAAGAAAAASGTLTVAIPADPGNLDPQLTLLQAARYVDSLAYDTLVNVEFSHPGKIYSGLAQSWKVLSPKKVEFTLRRGITCSDGSSMTASVVKQNLDFVGNPANKSPLLGVFMPVGATVTANNRARTVLVSTKTANPFMLDGLGEIQMICSRGLADRGLLAKGMTGTGPYRLVESVAGDHYTFAVRKGYTWGPGGATTAARGLPGRVVVKVVSNETTAANLLLTGGLNVATISGADRTRLDKAHLFRKIAAAAPVEFFFNEAPGHPTADPKVRRALVQAMNLAQIGAVGTAGRGVKMTTLVLKSLTPCPGNAVAGSVPQYSPQAARSALSSGPAVKLLYPTDEGASWTAAAELAQQQLAAAGAKVTLAPSSTAALQGTIFGSGDWDIVEIGIGLSAPDQLRGFLSGPTPPNGSNFAHIDNAGYNGAAAKAVRRVGAAGCRYWLDADRAIFRNADVAPTSFLTAAAYGKGATFALGVEGPLPTSFRLTK